MQRRISLNIVYHYNSKIQNSDFSKCICTGYLSTEIDMLVKPLKGPLIVKTLS